MKNLAEKLAVLSCLILGYVFSVQGSSQDFQCGQSVVGRVVGGTEVSRGVYPWMAVLMYNTNPPSLLCGATLITRKYSITAKHCLERGASSDYILVVGTTNLKDIHPDSVYDLSKYIFYPCAQNSPRWNYSTCDIALIETKREVNFGPYVQPICLPKVNQDFTGVHAVIVGFGHTYPEKSKENTKGHSSDVLLQGDVTVTSTVHCDEVLRRLYSLPIFDQIVCAGKYGGESSVCWGDSGGPLMYYNESSSVWTIIGVVSATHDCYDPSGYNMFSSVSRKMDWIAENSDCCN